MAEQKTKESLSDFESSQKKEDDAKFTSKDASFDKKPSKTHNYQKKQRGRKIEVIGHVISDRMDKTITVQIYRKVRHPRLGKYIKKSTKFKAHDEKNEASLGDQVLIHATRALSKTKYWKLSKIIKSDERSQS